MQDIKDYLSYDPITGLFTWVKTKLGTPLGNAGYISKQGYERISYKGKKYLSHRLAWYFIYGCMPECNIDHKNEIKSDNRISNLRLDVNGDNPQNVSKFKGITYNKRRGKWIAEITKHGSGKYLGQYNTPEEAHEAYLCAKRELHPFWVEDK
jgi:hypothetical protein